MNENTKICFKCGRELPITEFYKHDAMSDGHLNKCKECTRKDVHANYILNRFNKNYVEKERARGREKYARLGYSSKNRAVHNEGKNTRKNLEKSGIPYGAFELHHWNYNEKNDVIPLTRSEHKRVHRFLVFDEQTKMFRYKGKILSTRHEHQEAILDIMLNQ